jgi:hypothetical protein
VGAEWYLPLAPVARALGAQLALSSSITGGAGSVVQSRQIRVRRQDGLELVYDSSTGEIRQKFVLVGQIKDFRQVQLEVGIENIMFPLSGIVALFGVNIREDADHNALLVETAPGGGTPQHAAGGPSWNLGTLNYAYGLTTDGRQYGQFATLKGEAIVVGRRVNTELMLNRIPGRGFLGFSRGLVGLELDGARSLFFGDQSIFRGVEAFANTVRGVGFQAPWRGFDTYTYGGLSTSATFLSIGSGYARYDTSTVGFSLRRKLKGGQWSLGVNLFNSDSRRGKAVGAAYAGSRFRNQFSIQGLFGAFSGLSSRMVLVKTTQTLNQQLLEPQQASAGPLNGVPLVDENGNAIVFREEPKQAQVNGAAAGFSLADTFTPFKALSVTGQWERYGKNFLTAREDARFNATSNKALSVSLRPTRFFSVSGGATDRFYLLGSRDRSRGYNYSATGSLPGRFPVQLGFFRSIQMDALSPVGRFVLTQYSLALPNVRRISTFAYYSELKLGPQLVRNVNVSVNADYGRWGRIGVHEQLQTHTSQRIGLDWYRSLGRHDSFLRLGLDRLTGMNQKAALLPLAGVRIPLPRGHSLQVSYMADRNSHVLQLELGGSALHREMQRNTEGVARVIIPSPLIGRVYLDADLDGKFDAAHDRPINDVRVWLDGQKPALSDAQGMFRFDQVPPGAHRLRAELNGVPAGLVFSGSDERTVAVAPYQPTAQDFRVIPTGQIHGKVVYLDYSDDPDHPVERPLPDARVVATGDQDTYSETSGNFILGDLPPRQYQLRIDPASIPKGYASQPSLLTVTVRPGEVLRNVIFKLVIPPKPVIEKTLPPQDLQMGGASSSANAPDLPSSTTSPSSNTPARSPSPASPPRSQ